MDSSKTPFDDPGLPARGEDKPGRVSSATGAFGVVSTPQAREEDDLLKSLMQQPVASEPMARQPEPASMAASASPASPGEFTQILKTLTDLPSAQPRASSSPVAPAPKQGGDLAKVFRQVSIDKTAPPPAPVASPQAGGGPGSFTQMFGTLSAKPQEPAVAPAAPAAPAGVAAAPASSSPENPGSFTQMFSTLSGKPEQPAPDHAAFAPTIPAMSAPPAAASGPGEFTKIFQAIQAESRPGQREPVMPVMQTPPASSGSPGSGPEGFGPNSGLGSGPGSFTQMFSTLGTPSSRPQETLPSFEPRPAPASDFQFSSPARPAETSAQGGFTQLLQALNREPVPVKEEPPLAPFAPPSPQAPAPAQGGFTQLLRTLSAEPVAPAAPPPMAAPAQAVVAAPSSGQGEFTRVISGSALRDLQGAGGTTGAPAVAPAAAPPGYAPFQMPKAPQMPGAPAFPSMAQMPHAGAAPAPPAMPHFAPPAFQFPQAPVPPVAPPAAEPGKLQKYLPLILVLNVFVLLVIVLIVIFALHHK